MEVERAIKKQKEESKSAIDELRESVTKLEHAHDDLEQYGRRLCVGVEDILVANDETAVKVLRKVENILKEACSSLSHNVIDRHIVSGEITNVLKPIIPAAASLYISAFLSIEHRSIGTGIN